MPSRAQSHLGSRSMEVLAALRQDLSARTWPAGMQLPTESALCERFSVSRPTVRRALACLAEEGWIRTRQGAGSVVLETPAAPAPSPSRLVGVMFPFATESLSAVQGLCLHRRLLCCPFLQSFDRAGAAAQHAYLSQLQENRVRGLVACCSPAQPAVGQQLEGLTAAGIRVIHIEPHAPARPRQNHIVPDYGEAGRIATVELMLAGYETIRIVTLGRTPATVLLEEGASRTLEDHGGGYDPQRHHFALPETARYLPAARAEVERFVNAIDRPTGILCSSPFVAETLLEWLQARDLNIPGDIGLIALRYTEEHLAAQLDTLEFDRLELITRAVDAISRSAWDRVAEMERPRICRRGSVGMPG